MSASSVLFVSGSDLIYGLDAKILLQSESGFIHFSCDIDTEIPHVPWFEDVSRYLLFPPGISYDKAELPRSLDIPRKS